MRRFYLDEKLEQDKIFELPPETIHHITSVLRLKTGSPIALFNGKGVTAQAQLFMNENKIISARIVEITSSRMKTSLKVILAQALLTSSKFTDVLQKSTELGVDSIIPFSCARSLPMFPKKASEKKTARWQKITVEAARQSERDFVPEVNPPIKWAELITFSNAKTLKLIAGARVSSPLKNALRSIHEYDNLILVVGPEGGFTGAEISEAKAHGFIPVSLSKHILRTETAGPAALAMIAYNLSERECDG